MFEQVILDAGKPVDDTGVNFLTGCLFDSSSHHGSITTYVFTQQEQSEKYKEVTVTNRFGALWINYLWIEEPSNDPGGFLPLPLIVTGLNIFVCM